MKTVASTFRPLALAAAILAPASAPAWQIVAQNSASQVWSGYASAVSTLLNQGWHPTAVDVNYTAWNNDYTKLAVCVVRKEGAFDIPAKVFYDKTWEWIADWADENGYTVVDQDEYLKNGEKRYAAVLHKLDSYVSWFAYTQATTPWLSGFVSGNGGKVIDLDLEENGTPFLFGTIHWSNAYTGVTWDSSMPFADIGPYCNTYHKRILDIARRLDGNYCVLFCDEKPSDVGKWGWYGGASFTWLENAQAQGWRVQKRNSRTVSGVTTYSGVLVRRF